MSERQTDFFEARTDLSDEELADQLLASGQVLDPNIEDLDLSDSLSAGEDSVPRIPLISRDPKLALDDPKTEQFLRLIAKGANKVVAYWEAVNAKCTRKSALEQASRWLKVPANRERLRFLIREKKYDVSVAGGDHTRGGKDKPGRAAAMTKDDLIAALEKLIETTLNESAKIQAIERVARLRGFIREPGADKKEIPDPAYLGVFLRRAEEARQDPVEAAKRAQEGLEGGEQGEDPPVPKEAGPEASGDHAKQRGAQDVGGEA